jgi:hypothetical protein
VFNSSFKGLVSFRPATWGAVGGDLRPMDRRPRREGAENFAALYWYYGRRALRPAGICKNRREFILSRVARAPDAAS